MNYGGSTGYGREYRERLRGEWGIVDVDDCVNARAYLAREGLVDRRPAGHPRRQRRRLHDAGALDVPRRVRGRREPLRRQRPRRRWRRDTHKFESRYLDSLVGPYPAGARASTASARRSTTSSELELPGRSSSRASTTRSCRRTRPRRWSTALTAKGVPVAYLPFEGEEHGFRKAENIKRTAEAELYFYGRVFGFAPAGEIEPVEIANLPASRADDGVSARGTPDHGVGARPPFRESGRGQGVGQTAKVVLEVVAARAEQVRRRAGHRRRRHDVVVACAYQRLPSADDVRFGLGEPARLSTAASPPGVPSGSTPRPARRIGPR